MNTRRLLRNGFVIFMLATPLLWLAWCFLTAPAEVEKYPWGRRTLDSFGDGRFHVARFYPSNRVLFDGEKQQPLLDPVVDWRVLDDTVCAYGTDGEIAQRSRSSDYHGPRAGHVYLVLNYRTGSWTTFKRLEEVPARYQAEAGKLHTQ